MKHARPALLVVILALGAALAPVAGATVSRPPAAPEVAAPEPAPDKAPSPIVAVAEPPKQRTLEDDPPTDERTPAPTAAEWKAATAVTLSRPHPDCKAQRAREWLRITCKVSSLAAMDLLAGPREGVSFAAQGTGAEQAVVLPLRRGDRRVLQIVHVSSWSKYTVDYDAAVSISEDWLAGAPAPTVVVD